MFLPLQIREIFHLLFLQEFFRKFDPKLVVLKGGVNLRFFFKSSRYSEDMDLDLMTASLESVQKNVLRTLKAIATPMKVYGVTQIIPPSLQSAKQTTTTQRFKIHLHTQSRLDLFTKVEFSRRGFNQGYAFEKVEDTILRTYRLAPIVVQHYSAETAFEQKIKALAGRTEVQARDVFDLYQLISFLPEAWRVSVGKNVCQQATERVWALSFKEYHEAVVAYLKEEDQQILGLKEVWVKMQKAVADVFGIYHS
ncbi:MAG: nucleotidyl transferase AbiEii/AbiGii toxin family protein [Deltaproteobacteria bacterium]|nr:nucleotidyl transferase AbiEii/AbiGii toxin family protein [Deltaproteobacteria bacterium]